MKTESIPLRKSRCLKNHKGDKKCYCKFSNKYLYEKYPKSQNYCYSKRINNIFTETKSKEFINFFDAECLLEETDLMRR